METVKVKIRGIAPLLMNRFKMPDEGEPDGVDATRWAKSGRLIWGKYIIFIPLLVIFITGCAGIEAIEGKGGFSSFKKSLNRKTYGYQRVSAPQPVRAGESSERFEVRPGDCYWHRTWNDCINDRERSELQQNEPHEMVGQEYWYGWSIFFPNDYPNVYPTVTALGQFKQKGAKHPPVAFVNFPNGYWMQFVQIRGRHFQDSYLLIDEEELRGRWHDIVVHARWSNNDDGFIKVWVNDVLKADYSGALTKHVYQIYFKYGVYRNDVSLYKLAQSVDSVPTQVVYFDEVRKGRSREDVDIRLRK